MTLNAKQARFVEEYLIDLNATQAAQRAGYSAKTAYAQGQRLLKDVEVARAVETAMAERSRRTRITADQILQEMAYVGMARINRVVQWRRRGEAETEGGEGLEDQAHGGALKRAAKGLGPIEVDVVSSDDVPDEVMAAIAEISEGPNGFRVKLHDKMAALNSMAKHLGLFTEKVEVTGKDGGPVATVELSGLGDLHREKRDKVRAALAEALKGQ